jgi:1,4-dihydroxy-2-naphthoyl-CoA hydrolase
VAGEPQAPVDPEKTLGAVLGFETVETGPDRAVARFEVTDKVRQPMGIVHGGTYAALAEGMTSMATFNAVFPDGYLAMGLSNQTSFLRPVSHGTVTASARSILKGRTPWVWEVEFMDDRERLCCVTRMTIAVRPLPDRAPG